LNFMTYHPTATMWAAVSQVGLHATRRASHLLWNEGEERFSIADLCAAIRMAAFAHPAAINVI
jgi:hypothetical protein